MDDEPKTVKNLAVLVLITSFLVTIALLITSVVISIVYVDDDHGSYILLSASYLCFALASNNLSKRILDHHASS